MPQSKQNASQQNRIELLTAPGCLAKLDSVELFSDIIVSLDQNLTVSSFLSNSPVVKGAIENKKRSF